MGFYLLVWWVELVGFGCICCFCWLGFSSCEGMLVCLWVYSVIWSRPLYGKRIVWWYRKRFLFWSVFFLFESGRFFWMYRLFVRSFG